MQFLLTRFCAFLVFTTAVQTAIAQTDTIPTTSLDPKLIEWQNARYPREYNIADLKISGASSLDSSIVASVSGLQKGQKFVYPGTDIFSKAITNLWKQRLFADAKIYITKIVDDKVSIEIAVTERPRLGDFKFEGVRKTETEELTTKIGLQKGTIISENIRRNINEVVKTYFGEKGYHNVTVDLVEKPDPVYKNSNALLIKVHKGNKVKIEQVNFFGNENISSTKLKKQMKGTKEKPRLSLYRLDYQSPYGQKSEYTGSEYLKDWGFLYGSKTMEVLNPYFRPNIFASAKFNQKKYLDDKEKVLDYFNSKGYRDAQILADTQIIRDGNMFVDLKVKEGRRYYFGNITWKGNSKYSDTILNRVLGINKGDIYDAGVLNKKLGIEPSQDGGDLTTVYQDEGYLFFQVIPVETGIHNDTIDHEIRIIEGPIARIKNVNIMGNERTKEHVIRRELRTLPGALFSRSDLMRSVRELNNLNYFEQESINPRPVPNQEDGTVDINWSLKEKSSDQLELSAGWGGGIGLTGTLGVTFNNFSIKNIWKKSAWDPLPVGDGQKLSLRVQSNGKAYRSYNFSFTEPWLGGKKRNSLTLAYNNTKYHNYDPSSYYSGNIKVIDSVYLLVNGFSVGLGKQLKWPDDYFSIGYTIAFTRYNVSNMGYAYGLPFNTGISDNLSFKIGVQRSSVFDPIFPRSGSDIMASVQFTPPYSALKDVSSVNQYRNVEYHKWKLSSTWYIPLGRPKGEDKNRQFVLKLAAKYGFMGRYNRDIEYSPFERFQLGDAGMNNTYALTGFDIVSQRGYPIYVNSDPTINPENPNTNNRFIIFNKYVTELRYPLVTNPGSTIYGLGFFEAANGWYNYKDYNPFKLRRSVGLGMRFYLPMFGLLGFDYGIGIDRLTPGGGIKGAGKFTFMLGFEPE
ncbi:MAG: outer membrane protein assembly factor [Niabella sp.]